MINDPSTNSFVFEMSTRVNEDLTLAASRALDLISSSAQARSQPGTPLEARDSNQQVEPGDGVDIFLPSKPKSRLRQMAEKSARKYSITSLPPQIDCSQPDIVLDLGTPTPARINTPAVNYRPSSRRRSSPRRSSLASRKSLSPIKPAQTPVESLLDRLKLSERGSPLDHKHTTLDGKGSIFSSVLGDSVEHLPQISKHRSSLSLNPPSKLNSQQHSEDESDSISSVQDSNDKPECNEISEVFEALECDLQDGDKNLVGQHEKSSDSEDDLFDPLSLIPEKIDDVDDDDDEGGIEEEEPIICQKNKSLNKNTRSKLVVEDSDSDDNFHVSTSRARNSSILAQQDTSISLNSEVVSTDSGDSGEVLPSRAVQLRETRLKALEKIANKKQFKLFKRDCTTKSKADHSFESFQDEPSESSIFAAELSRNKADLITEKQQRGNLIDLTSSPEFKPSVLKINSSKNVPLPKATKKKDTNGTSKRASTKKELPFAKRRVELANNLIELLNQKVFDMKLPEKIEIIWNGRFKSTAGKAKWTLFKNTSGEILRQNVSIELSSKVLDSEQKLKNTLAHELCHVATWIIDHQKDEKHGHYFKTWAARVHKAIPDIIVKTKHDYEITYKYNWGCDRKGCPKIYSRHSKSINPDRHGCVCGGLLVLLPQVKNEVSKKNESTENDSLSQMMNGLKVDEEKNRH